MGGHVGERVGARVCHNVAELRKGRLVLEVSCIVKVARSWDLLDLALLLINVTSRAWFGVGWGGLAVGAWCGVG